MDSHKEEGSPLTKFPSESNVKLPPTIPGEPVQSSNFILLPISPQDSKTDTEVELDDDASQQMTTSYSEISFKSGMSPETEVSLSLTMDPIPSVDHIFQRPVSLTYDKDVSKQLLPLNSEGTVHKEGNMTHFVTEDLEYKIKISSPVSKLSGNSKSETPNYMQKSILISSVGNLDTNILNDLEFEAQKIATSVDTLTENLCGILHSISSITADNVDIYKDAVSKMSDAMDCNIKSIYTVMAKTEELSYSMISLQHLALRIKELRRLMDLFESLKCESYS